MVTISDIFREKPSLNHESKNAPLLFWLRSVLKVHTATFAAKPKKINEFQDLINYQDFLYKNVLRF